MYTVQPATADRWEDVAAVMGTRGDPSRCWCQYFMMRRKDWHASTVDTRREMLREQVCRQDVPPGVLAYTDGTPVGWCAIARKSSYPRLRRSPLAGSGDDDGVWSVTCFVVTVGHRRRGMTSALLQGAIDLARAHDARTIEAYAVDPSARTSVSAAELYFGPLSVYTSAGFTEVARPYPARPRMRLDL
ncbi:N-acetyltransferase [Actinobacteria bacterium YIM 96077]|uniref:GNAT family N-acetyltransferase n=1 Tax=Phytoactinopolyspora halophila TaxID=1981511 RepID=A0A329QNU6_9ACTN|nr:GNAT family N-acetyltransferase [Phytoactinopolyspora halophila]AYY14579.1 N-acetyltransferase [Actinobacteria bacterium YIM 96077]RAW14044.1 GNAT family N-acetyltransferase [Phytoactinopolyspora halophila]